MERVEQEQQVSWTYQPPSNLGLYGPSFPAATLGQALPPAQAPPLRLQNRQVVPPKSDDAWLSWAVRAVGAVALGYHGWRRSRGSWPWTIGWAAVGAVAPVVGGMAAAFQGFGSRPAKEED